MISVSRLLLSAVAILFGLYHPLLGYLYLDQYAVPGLAVAGIALYLLTLLLVTLNNPGLKMRPSSAVVAFVAIIVLPQMIFSALGDVRQESYTTWHIAAIGTVLAIMTVRQFELLAWFGFVIVTFQVLLWGGVEVIFNSGLVGAFLLVATAQTASFVLATSGREAAEFRSRALEIDTATAASTAARAERTTRVKETLKQALPLLEKIRASQGELSDDDKSLARLTEAELRDQIRGRNLVSREVVAATRSARASGVEVQLLDDGGLDDLSIEDREKYYAEIVRALKKVKLGKIVIRAARGETWRVSMAAIRKDSDSPDLFIRI
ncbi:MAG: hypothetical protein DCO81_00110 [Candidatus Aquiluna sp. XM-24bin5]|nr:MAG: hypothetical protein DCO81_00110 [Candidatus Aquiluna sp. XM-24bin5]